MDESRILIIGSSGQLALALKQALPKATSTSRDMLDITNGQAVADYNWDTIDTIINASAYTNVGNAETPEGRVEAWRLNGLGVANLARAAAANNKTLVHVSTDYVYDGSQTTPYAETDPVAPLGVYAQSKLAGEIAVTVAPKYYVLRTSWLIGDGPNFVRSIMGLAARDISPAVVHDQVGRLTFTPMLAEAIVHLLNVKAEFGTYNVSNIGPTGSWADVARQIYQDMGRGDLAVTNTTAKEYFADKPDKAPRPARSTFDLSKIKATGLQLRDWRDDLKKYIAENK